MKVSELMRKLSAADPDAEVVTGGSDHSYVRITTASPILAEIDGRHLSEWDTRASTAKTVGVFYVGTE